MVNGECGDSVGAILSGRVTSRSGVAATFIGFRIQDPLPERTICIKTNVVDHLIRRILGASSTRLFREPPWRSKRLNLADSGHESLSNNEYRLPLL